LGRDYLSDLLICDLIGKIIPLSSILQPKGKPVMYSIQTAIQEFIGHCRFEKNLSPKTIKSYSIDLKQLTNFLIGRKYPVKLTRVTKIELREFLEEISSLKPKSIKRKVATIKAMFNYLEFEDKISSNPLRKMLIRIKEPQALPRVMDINEVAGIFRWAYMEKSKAKDMNRYSYLRALRNIAVVELLFATGARVSEIANLKVENINLITGTVKIRGKGNKERVIQICNKETLKALKDYYAAFSEKIETSGGFFLINRLGSKLSDQSIRTIVENLANQARISRHITPHVFRHSFATLLLEKGVDIKYIQLLLGHTSIMTTQIYTHVNREKQRQILKTKHPRKDFSMRVI
jgi:integrase/recombinase XerD